MISQLRKLLEQELIARKYMAIHKNIYEIGLYSSALLIKLINSNRKLYYAKIITVKLKASL